MNVRCTVNDCEYWRNNNWCGAGQILVTAADRPGVSNHHGEGAEHAGATPIEDSHDSYCYTFEKAE